MSSESPPEDISPHLRGELVRFVRALRAEGAAVPANAGTTAARALAEVGLTDRDRTRVALRASLVADPRDVETFERLFERFWEGLALGEGGRSGDVAPEDPDGELAGFEQPPAPAGSEESVVDETGDDGPTIDRSVAGTDREGPADDADGTTSARYSPSGTARQVSGEHVRDGGDLATAVHDLGRALADLEGRRYRSGGALLDVRRALRTSANTGGTVTSIPRREPDVTAVRAVFLVDVSRSVLDAIERGFLVEFLRRIRRSWRDVRVFFFDEALREVTPTVDAESTAAAFEALAAAETAWGGGTRIGDSIGALLRDHPAVVDRRTAVFVISDGLEMGDVDGLERACSDIARLARRVLWLNPLAASPAYEPTARGMAAALPYLDGLFAFAGPSDVDEMARQLRRRGPGAGIGLEGSAPGATDGTANSATGRDTP